MPQFDRLTIRRIAVDAEVDERTVRKELREPGSVRGLSGDRLRRALAARGLGAHPASAPEGRGGMIA